MATGWSLGGVEDVARLARQLLGQDAPARAIGLDDDGTPGLDVGAPTAGQVGAELGGRQSVAALRQRRFPAAACHSENGCLTPGC
jgi:hypothetical protein